MNKLISFLFILVLHIFSFANEAASAHGEAEQGIPVKTIIFQSVNLGLLLIVLFLATRKSISALFKAKLTDYKEQAQKTAQANLQAEEALAEIKNKIENLKKSEAEVIKNANSEAVIMKNKLIKEAELQAEKMKSDVQMVVSAEVYNAKSLIREELIDASLKIAQKNIQAQSEQITKKSEAGYIDDILKVKNQVNA